MNNIFISSILAVFIFTGCQDITTVTDDEDSDEYENSELHYQGEACLSCHGYSSGSVEYDERFTSGGTVYTTINSLNSYATGYKIRLLLENTLTTVTYEIEEGDGNSFTEYPEGSINSYTAQVVDSRGVVVNSSLTNSHDVTRLDCNTCHTASGTGGAPGRIVSYDYYASNQTTTDTTTTTTTTDTTATTTVSFANEVMPVLDTNCKVCHTTGGMNENFLVSDTLSTYTNISTNNYVDTLNVDNSTLLVKALGNGHGGGTILNTTDTEYQTLKDWITQGALNN